MANALNIVATSGDGDAPENAVPVTLWGGGSGGGSTGDVTFDDVTGEITVAGNTIPNVTLDMVLSQVIFPAMDTYREDIAALRGRVEALEA